MAEQLSRRPTLADVARRSGVTAATVSYVLNETPGQTISEPTQARVRAAAAELGYVPSVSAQALARGRSRVVLIDLSGIPLTRPVADARSQLTDAFEARGYIPVVQQSSERDETHAGLLVLAQALSPSAVLTGMSLPDAVRSRLTSVGVDVIISGLAESDDVAAMLDAGTHEQLRHLHDTGHRIVAYTPLSSEIPSPLEELRLHSVRREAAALGLALHVMRGSTDPLDIAAELDALCALEDRPTAVATYNDEVGVAVLFAAHRLEWNVPADLAVIGLGDAPVGALTWPALTTVRFLPVPTALTPAQLVEAVLKRSPQPSVASIWEAAVVRRDSA